VLQPEDTVIAVVPHAAMPGLLTAIHRGGFGHLTKVMDERRSPASGQLERAGVAVPPGFAVDADEMVVLVAAQGRIAVVRDLVTRHGARAVWETQRIADPWPMFKTALAARGRRSTSIELQTAD
jgi:hypothetical protein